MQRNIPIKKKRNSVCNRLQEIIYQSTSYIFQLFSPSESVCDANSCSLSPPSMPSLQTMLPSATEAKNQYHNVSNAIVPVNESTLFPAHLLNLANASFSKSFLTAVPEELMTKILKHFQYQETGIFFICLALKTAGLYKILDIEPYKTFTAPATLFFFSKVLKCDKKKISFLTAVIATIILVSLYDDLSTVPVALTSGVAGHYCGKLSVNFGLFLQKPENFVPDKSNVTLSEKRFH